MHELTNSQTIARLPAGEREHAVTQALRLINDETTDVFRDGIVDAIAGLPAIEREHLVTQTLRVISQHTNGSDRRRLIQTIARLPAGEREHAVTQALRLINEASLESMKIDMVEVIGRIPAGEREQTVTHTLRCISDETGMFYRFQILFRIRELPLGEREAAVNQALTVIRPDDDGHRRLEIINLILAFPVAFRARIVFDQTRYADHFGAQPALPQSLQTTLVQVANDPRRTLAGYARNLINGLPNVNYSNSQGIDAGGLRRDFITRLFSNLFTQDAELPAERLRATVDAQGLLMPNFSHPAELEGAYNIGIILGEILAGRLQATTGIRFSALLFQMLHSLNAAEIPPRGQLVIESSTYNKLLSIYAKSKYPWLEETEMGIIANGNLPARLQIPGIENLHDLASFVGFNDALLHPVLSIASGIASRTSWNERRTASPEELGEAIQGRFSKEAVIRALAGNQYSVQKGYLIRWIQESDESQVRKFLFCISGSETVGRNPLLIYPYRVNGDQLRLPSYHTCTLQIDLPRYNPPHDGYEIFKEKLEMSLSSAGRPPNSAEEEKTDEPENDPFQTS